VANLHEIAPPFDDSVLLQAIADEFTELHQLPAVSALEPLEPLDTGKFPGLTETVAQFESWEWTFGQTPPFSVTESLSLTGHGTAVGRLCYKFSIAPSPLSDRGFPNKWY
jgi:hypothetical protein